MYVLVLMYNTLHYVQAAEQLYSPECVGILQNQMGTHILSSTSDSILPRPWLASPIHFKPTQICTAQRKTHVLC